MLYMDSHPSWQVGWLNLSKRNATKLLLSGRRVRKTKDKEPSPPVSYTHTHTQKEIQEYFHEMHVFIQCTFYVLLVYCDTLHSNICIHCTEFLYCWNPWIKKKKKRNTIDHGILVSYLRYTYKHVQYKHNFIVFT